MSEPARLRGQCAACGHPVSATCSLHLREALIDHYTRRMKEGDAAHAVAPVDIVARPAEP